MLSQYYAVPGALLLLMALCFGVAAVLVTREVVKREPVKPKSRTTARPFRPNALTGIDFLVIGVIALTFVAIASVTI